jgi:hypothetical protein
MLGAGLALALLSILMPCSAASGENVAPGFTVDLTYDAVWGEVMPGDAVTITRTGDGAYGAAEADATGFFWTPLWRSNGRPVDVVDGDELQVYVNDALEATIDVVGASGGIDVLADEVSVTISGDTGGTLITMTVGLMGELASEHPGANPPQETAITNGDGTFTSVFGDVDLGPVNLVTVEYASGDQMMRFYAYPNDRVFAAQNLMFVQGYADPGQEVNVTVYEGSGPGMRWSGSAVAGQIHGFYKTWMPVPDEEDAPQAGDRVEVNLGGEEVLSTTLSSLSITSVDPVSDVIAGTAPAAETVTIRIWPLEGHVQKTAAADGSGAFTVDLDGVGDLQPRDWFRLAWADNDGNESVLVSGAPFLDVQVDPQTEWDCTLWRVDAPFVPVTLILETPTQTYT